MLHAQHRSCRLLPFRYPCGSCDQVRVHTQLCLTYVCLVYLCASLRCFHFLTLRSSSLSLPLRHLPGELWTKHDKRRSAQVKSKSSSLWPARQLDCLPFQHHVLYNLYDQHRGLLPCVSCHAFPNLVIRTCRLIRLSEAQTWNRIFGASRQNGCWDRSHLCNPLSSHLRLQRRCGPPLLLGRCTEVTVSR